MDFVTANKHVLSNYVNFSGRASRSEYWYAFLGFMITLIIANILDDMTGFPVFSLLLTLALFIPLLALSVRRLHDIEKSAWWILLSLVPVVGSIILLVFFCLPGTMEANRFGPDPLARS